MSEEPKDPHNRGGLCEQSLGIWHKIKLGTYLFLDKEKQNMHFKTDFLIKLSL